MKKLLRFLPVALLALTVLSLSSCKDDKDEPFSYDKLPAAAKTFVSTYFSNTTVKSVKYDQDDQEYEVYFNNGYDVTFNMAGEWTDVNSPENKAIPDGIAPTPIVEFVEALYPNVGIKEISKESYGYAVELVNGIDFKFNQAGENIGVES